VRDQAQPVGVLQDIRGVVRLAAEFARQRPFGAGVVAMDAAEHARARRVKGNLFDLGLAIDREQGDAELERRGDLGLFLDRVAVGDAVGGGAGSEHHLGLADRGDVEARAQRHQHFQDFGGRIGLHGVVHLGVRQALGEGHEIVADDVEVDHEARPFHFAVLEKFPDACGHLDPCSPGRRGGSRLTKPAATQSSRLLRERDITRGLPWSGSGKSRSARPARKDKPFQFPADTRRRSKKARSVVALSRVPR